MKRRPARVLTSFAVLGAVACALCLALLSQGASISEHEQVDRPPRIDPDYADIVIPPNIAPLNFCVDEPGKRYSVKIHSTHGKEIGIGSRDGRILIPPRAWRKLLDANKGEKLYCDVYVKAADGRWRRFETITNTIARDEIDGYLVYRLIGGTYNIYVNMSVSQRNLENYRETVVLDNSRFGGCMNCHTFLNNRPQKMTIQMRSGRVAYGSGTILIVDAEVSKVDTRTDLAPAPPVYMSWHPSGRAVAFSMNKVRQFFHTGRTEVRDVVDLDSDLAVYVLDPPSVTSTAAIAKKDRLETYPAWSPDGRHLYFCSAPILWPDQDKVPPEHYDEVRYDLMRISYDVQTHTWGAVETVLSADDTGLSATLPKISPDGRFLLFCMADYGCFPIHLASADLYLMDLQTGQHRRLAINSDQSDTWHSWSSNSRWFVFSSRRRNGLLARPYFAYVDENGKVCRPFVLPQKDPTFYGSFLKTYNVPELIQEPIPVTGEDIGRVIRESPWAKVGLPVTSATPSADQKPESPPAYAPP